jgi:sialate O-acetylesterase
MKSNVTCILALLLLSMNASSAELKVASVFGSHMVLQQEMPCPVWGWADPGETISVQFDTQNVTAKADDKGSWRVNLEPLKADGKSHTLTIKGKTTIAFDDVLIGEVWLGSGQSNMAYSVGKGADASMNIPEIRLLQVPQKMEKKPAQTIEASWQVCTPETVSGFSAALFYFGQKIHSEIKVPIGLINSSRGSTAIQQFMPPPKPGPLYNGSIAPLVPFAMRGTLWYQGEANVQQGQGLAYAEMLKTMIEGWRKEWGSEFSFYIVQLAPLKNYKPDTLPPVWEAQNAMLKLPRTGMSVTLDLAGNMSGIHPADKKNVGLRLALWALAKDYGRKDIEYSGPLFKAAKVEGKHIRVTFSHAGGLKARDGKDLTEFEIAGPDGRYVPAKATIDGETVLVESTEITAPTTVRFAWSNAPSPNLVNAANLPAAAFHSDNWTGSTGE